MPLAGAIFVLEITRASSGMHAAAYESLTPAAIASCSSMLMARAALSPAKPIGGHFVYGAVSPLLSGHIHVYVYVYVHVYVYVRSVPF